MAELSGRTALVTGGGTGIGFGIAQGLLQQGAAVTIAGRREEVLKQAATRLVAAVPGADVRHSVCDITQEAQVEAAVAAAARGGHLDICVANAGSGFPGAILQMSADAWRYCCDLNIVGTALCIKHAALSMREHGGGSIIAISSTSAERIQPWMSAYNTTKAGLEMLVKCAAFELSPFQIRVNSIQPGFTTTEAVDANLSPQDHETYVAHTPLGRAGTPTDIAGAVLYLASDAARWVTGQSWGVDGGLNLHVMPGLASIARVLYGEELVARCGVPDYPPKLEPPKSKRSAE